MLTNAIAHSPVRPATAAPEPMPFMEQAFNELENQTRILDNSIGCLESKIGPILQPAPPKPAATGSPVCGDGPHSQTVERLRGYAAMIQSFASRVNDMRDQAEC